MRALLAILLLVWANSAFAASKSQFFIHGGPALCRGSYDSGGAVPGSQNWTHSIRFMPSLGVGARLWASESTFLRVGVDFWPGGGLLDTGGSDLRWNLDYLALPVSVGRFLGDSELGGPYVHAGGVFALAVSEKWEFADLSGDSRGPGYDLGPVVGIGYDRISGSRVGIATELFWGLIDQSDDPEARADVIFLNRSVRVLLEVAIGTQAGE